MIKKTLTIEASEGLHARPAANLAKAVNKFSSEIFMYKDGNTENKYQTKSLLSILSMGAVKGDKITFTVEGSDEAEAIAMIEQVLSSEE